MQPLTKWKILYITTRVGVAMSVSILEKTYVQHVRDSLSTNNFFFAVTKPQTFYIVLWTKSTPYSINMRIQRHVQALTRACNIHLLAWWCTLTGHSDKTSTVNQRLFCKMNYREFEGSIWIFEQFHIKITSKWVSRSKLRRSNENCSAPLETIWLFNGGAN